MFDNIARRIYASLATSRAQGAARLAARRATAPGNNLFAREQLSMLQAMLANTRQSVGSTLMPRSEAASTPPRRYLAAGSEALADDISTSFRSLEENRAPATARTAAARRTLGADLGSARAAERSPFAASGTANVSSGLSAAVGRGAKPATAVANATVTDADAPTSASMPTGASIAHEFSNPARLRAAIVMAEVLGPPVALRDR